MARVKRLNITPDFILLTGKGKFEVIANEIAPTAKIRSIGVDNNGLDNYFFIILEDDSFDDVEDGGLIPELTSPMWRRIEE